MAQWPYLTWFWLWKTHWYVSFGQFHDAYITVVGYNLIYGHNVHNVFRHRQTHLLQLDVLMTFCGDGLQSPCTELSDSSTYLLLQIMCKLVIEWRSRQQGHILILSCLFSKLREGGREWCHSAMHCYCQNIGGKQRPRTPCGRQSGTFLCNLREKE